MNRLTTDGWLNEVSLKRIKIKAASLQQHHALPGRIQVYSRYIKIFRAREVAAFLDARPVMIGDIFSTHYIFHWATRLSPLEFLLRARKFIKGMYGIECQTAGQSKVLADGVYLVTLKHVSGAPMLPLDKFQNMEMDALMQLPLSDLRAIKVATGCGDLFFELDREPDRATAVENDHETASAAPTGPYRVGLISHQQKADWLDRWFLLTHIPIEGEGMTFAMEWRGVTRACLDIFMAFGP